MLSFQTARRARGDGVESKGSVTIPASRSPASRAQALPPSPGAAWRQPVPTYASVRLEVPRGPSLSMPLQQRERATPLPGVAKAPMGLGELDPQMRATMMVIELMEFLQDHLAEEPRPHRPALLGELAETVRQVALNVPDEQWGESFSALVQLAGHDTLAEDHLVPVFHAMVRGPEELGHLRLGAAVSSMTGHFKDRLLPAHWYRAMMRAAQQAWDADHGGGVRKAILWLLEGSVIDLAQDDPRRIAQDKAMLLAAVQTCADAPQTPVGLVACMQRSMMREAGPRITARVFEALTATPDLSPAQLDNVMGMLGAGVVARLEPAPAQLAHRLRPLLAWTLQQPPAHRESALAGLVSGISLHPPSTPMGAAYLQAVVHLVGQLHGAFVAAGARDEAARFIARMAMPAHGPVNDKQAPWTASGPSQHLKDGKDDAKATDRPTTRPDLKAAREPATGPASAHAEADTGSGAVTPTAAGALAGLRLLLGWRTGEAAPLDLELRVIGRALAISANGDRGMPIAALPALVEGLVDSDIPDRQAGLLLQGLAQGMGGADMGEPAFGAFVQALCLTSATRGALLSCHVFTALDATGAAGRAQAVPLSLRIAHTVRALPQPLRERMGLPAGEVTLPPGLLLGVNLADGPLAAVRDSDLSRDAQRQLLAGAYRVPGLLDEALIADEAQDSALLAVDDPGLALEAARHLLEQGSARVGAASMRLLRAGLLAQVLGPQATGRDGMPLADGLGRIGALYEAFVRGRGDPREATTQAFLAHEATLLRGGPHGSALEPLAGRLDALRAPPPQDGR